MLFKIYLSQSDCELVLTSLRSLKYLYVDDFKLYEKEINVLENLIVKFENLY